MSKSSKAFRYESIEGKLFLGRLFSTIRLFFLSLFSLITLIALQGCSIQDMGKALLVFLALMLAGGESPPPFTLQTVASLSASSFSGRADVPLVFDTSPTFFDRSKFLTPVDSKAEPNQAFRFVIKWDFGDGTTGQGAPFTHVYAAPGTYKVTVTVCDLQGNELRSAMFIIVIGPALNAIVANSTGDSVTLINLDTLVTTEIAVGNNPIAARIAPNGITALAANFNGGGNSTTSVIDLITKTKVIDLITGQGAIGIDFTSDSKTAYVSSQVDDVVTVLDLTNNTVVTSIPLGGFGGASVVLAPDEKRAYATGGTLPNAISVIDTTTNTKVTEIVTTFNNPSFPVFTPDGSLALSGTQGSRLVAINTTTLTTTDIFTASSSIAPVVTPDSKKAFVSNRTAAVDFISVVDLVNLTKITDVQVGNQPGNTAITPDGKKVLALSEADDTVAFIDTTSNQQIGSRLTVGGFPRGIRITPDGKRAVVVNFDDETLSIIDIANQLLITDIPVGNGPLFVGVTPK